ncbi:MAG TPA: HlyD family efflux transporter periplasmic adaptor subunit [Caldimonas sp.]
MDRPPPPLFRQVALDAAAGTQIGEALKTHWRGVAWFTLAAFALLAALVVFVATVEYSPVHRIASFVDAKGGLVRLKAPIDGRVSRLAVKDGAMVKKGDLLAVIGSERLREEGGGERAAVRQSVDAEKAMIGREIDAARQEAAMNRIMLERRLHGLREERETLRADIRSGERLLVSLTAQSDHVASAAAEGYLPRQQAAQKRDEVSAQESRLASAKGALARVERDIETSDAERQLIDARLAGVIENRQRSNGELNRLTVQSDMNAEQAIRAPQDGRVSFASLAAGQSVEAGQPLFTLAPANDSLVLKLLVAPAAVASVRPGVAIKLTFRAYPQERFGLFDARVDSVNEIPSLPGEVPQVTGMSEPMFVATATLPGELRSASGQALPLKPGMLADALVPIERRTVLEWLLDPILRGLNDSVGRVAPGAADARR